ncbi:hypothetical protein [Sphingomonas sp. IW22]
MQRGDLKINVAEKIGKIYVNGQRAEIFWTKDDLAAFREGGAREGSRGL